ncbi:Protein cms1 [Leucoagaricus sp. SymC.cos]|nr:Protein cms1 [Leucoagaricus sp. SymC.cos]
MADDLEDDFVPDETTAFSEDNEGLLLDDAAYFSEQEEPAPPPAPSSKKRKRREKEKEKKKRKLVENVDQEVTSVAEQSPGELASYLSGMQKKSFPDHSPIELSDLEIPDSSIADTTAWTGPRTLDQLVPFITKILPVLHTRLSQRSKTNGAPTLLFLAGAALRAADITRVLRDKKLRGDKGGEVAKLFAKHFKLSDQVSYLKRTKAGTAVGTPGRVGKLLCETDALSVSALTHIILDVSYTDAKRRNLLDITETRDELFKIVLGAPQVLKAIKEGKIQIVLF